MRKINLTEEDIYNAVKSAFMLKEERLENPNLLEYSVLPGVEKNDGTISAWFLNFYVSNAVYSQMMSIIKSDKERSFSRFITARKSPKAKPGKEMELSLRLLHAEEMIDKEGQVVQDFKTAAGTDVMHVAKLYRAYTSANGGERPSESVKSIIEDVTRTIKHKITGAACRNAVKSAYELWKELSEKLGSEEVQTLINNITISYTDDSIIDHKLSVGNKLRALGQARKYGMEITYLATANNWRGMFNRRVKPNAFPIFLIVPWVATVGKKDTKAYAQSQGIPDPDSMSAQQYLEAFVRANAINLPKGYGWAVYYDVSQTELMTGEKDEYNDNIGFENNLNGTPNQYTRTAIGLGQADSDELSKVLYNGDKIDTDRALIGTQYAAQKLNSEVINPQGDNQNAKLYCIKQMVEKMAEKCVADGRIIRPENAKPIVDYVVMWVLYTMKMPPAMIAKVPSMNEKMNIIAYNFFQKIIWNIENGIKASYKQTDAAQAATGTDGGAVAESGIDTVGDFHFDIPSKEQFCANAM